LTCGFPFSEDKSPPHNEVDRRRIIVAKAVTTSDQT